MSEDTVATLPAGTSVGSVHLRVADSERSLEFYGSTLALVARPAATSSPDTGSGSALVRVTAVPGAGRRPEGVLGLYHFAVLYPDRASLARVLDRLIEAQWRFTGFADHGVSEAAYLLDPDGIGVELYVDRPRAFWPRSADGRLMMYTKPLDVDGLLAEAARPAGEAGGGEEATPRIGHMHFHVSDTRRSTDFYHGVVGFDVMQDAIPGAVFLGAGGYHHHVGVNTWARGRTADPAAARLIDWTIRVPGEASRTALIRRLNEAGTGGRPVSGPDADDRAGLRDGDAIAGDGAGPATFVDPDGNVLIVEATPRLE